MIDFEAGEVRIPADVWLTVEPIIELHTNVVSHLKTLVGLDWTAEIIHDLFTEPTAGFILFAIGLAYKRLDIVPFRELSASGGGKGTAHLSHS